MPVMPRTQPVICPSHSHQIRSGPFDCSAETQWWFQCKISHSLQWRLKKLCLLWVWELLTGGAGLLVLIEASVVRARAADPFVHRDTDVAAAAVSLVTLRLTTCMQWKAHIFNHSRTRNITLEDEDLAGRLVGSCLKPLKCWQRVIFRQPDGKTIFQN